METIKKWSPVTTMSASVQSTEAMPGSSLRISGWKRPLAVKRTYSRKSGWRVCSAGVPGARYWG